jgi:serine/threonine protein kinase
VNKAPLNDEQIIDYAFGIARGMLHLHLNNIVHRDLAARNVLVCALDVLTQTLKSNICVLAACRRSPEDIGKFIILQVAFSL